MEDRKRWNGEDIPTIKQSEIDAWNRGKSDAQRNKLLKSKVSANQAVEIVRMFSGNGDPHHVAMRLNLPVETVRRVLASFEITSIEDAREAVNSGVISELDQALAGQQDQDGATQVIDYEAASERLVEQQEALEEKERTPNEIDQDLATRRDEAQKRNKADRLRQMIADGIDIKSGKTTFRIPMNQVRTFKSMIPRGVSHLRRQFGGTEADIVSEIERLAPEYDKDMLRP